jgi:hypothetical protein
MANGITLDDLLATESTVLNRIARDLEERDFTETNMAGHYSSTGGHSSSGTHNSHTSGVSSAIPLHKISDECKESK